MVGSRFTVTQMLSATQDTANVTPAALTVAGTNSASAFLLSGPTPASATVGPAGTTFTWVYQATTEGSAGQITFSGNASDGTATWPWATSNSVTVNPPPDSVFTTWATVTGTVTTNAFTTYPAMLDSGLGPNGTYAYGNKVKGALGGFIAEVTPGTAISKVELVMQAYISKASTKTIKYQTYLNGTKIIDAQPSASIFNGVVGAANANLVYLDITGGRAWQWADFDNDLQVLIDQTGLGSGEVVYYDAIGLRVTSRAGAALPGDAGGDTSALATVDTSKQANFYDQVIRASDLWNTATILHKVIICAFSKV